uniref:Uncharacterized protein n=1 Tax=Avena sativa TaxID=4498 RepID=A0ACD5Y1I7_AVESA
MAAGGSSGICHEDLYGVLGLKKECSDADLRIAYRKLAMTWHPDRCSASGSSARVEEAKERFQEIQGAYSVLSDTGKRLLYDVGAYDDSGDDGEEQDVSGMGDFLGEMAQMMSQATPAESFEELQQLFVDMFQGDLAGGFGSGFTGRPPPVVHPAQSPRRAGVSVNKRCSSATDSEWWRPQEAPRTQEDASNGDRKKRQKLSTSHGVSSASRSPRGSADARRKQTTVPSSGASLVSASP